MRIDSCRRSSSFRPFSSSLFISTVLLLLPGSAPAQETFADSFDDWSTAGVQNADDSGWYYGYYNLTQDEIAADGIYQTDDFLEFDPAQHWSGFQWDLLNAAAGPWTEIGQESTHPNGTNSAPGEEHWTIRRWVCDVDADAAVMTWHMRHVNTACGGNGVSGYLFLNGEQIDTAAVGGPDSVGFIRSVTRDLHVGDIVDLALGPTGTDGVRGDGCDGSANRLTIGSAPPDADADGVSDADDNCKNVPNEDQLNSDTDSLGDACDNCPNRANLDQADTDGNGIGDSCEPGRPIADSVLDWTASGTQGEFGWFAGYYDLTSDADSTYQASDFTPFEAAHWNGSSWYLPNPGPGPWTSLEKENTHPNGTNSAPNQEHWTIRRWVSDRDEPLSLQWHMREVNAGGTGVSGYLFLNGEQLDTVAIAGGDTTGVTRVRARLLKKGDIVDLALGPTGAGGDRGDGADGSANSLTITPVGDTDGDGKDDLVDNCTDVANPDQADGDTDGYGDLCDNCPAAANSSQADRDGNGIGDACTDTDGDGVMDTTDNCLRLANAAQTDGDGDSVGDACDNCPTAANTDQADRERDGIGDSCAPAWLADSSADWSVDGVQGENGWYNGYYNLTLDQNLSDGVYQFEDFIEFDAGFWSGIQWDLTPAASGPWTEIGRDTTHSNGTNSAPGEEHWTIRRWESSHAGDAVISWHLRKTNPNGSGVTGILFLNGEELDRGTIWGQDSTGFTRIVKARLADGDVVDLAHTPVGVCGDTIDGSDGSANLLTIYAASTTGLPSPGAVIADSQLGWSTSGTQGENGWSYGYYDVRDDFENGDATYKAADFIEFVNAGGPVDPSLNHWNGAFWDFADNGALGAGPWTELTCAGGHPAANGQTDTMVHWAVRRWKSDVDGDVRVSGYFLNGGAGDGVMGRVYLNDGEIFSDRSDGIGVSFSVRAAVKTGDTIDFIIDADGSSALAQGGPDAVNDGSDGTVFIATVVSVEPATLPGPTFRRGDADSNGALELTDAVKLLNYLFLGQAKPECLDAADVDDSGEADISDAISNLNYQFLGGPAPVNPGPATCGLDPKPEVPDLGCDKACG